MLLSERICYNIVRSFNKKVFSDWNASGCLQLFRYIIFYSIAAQPQACLAINETGSKSRRQDYYKYIHPWMTLHETLY